MVRQLIYDFRQWRKLEATGRAGGDDGYDARGWEVTDLSGGGDAADQGDDEDQPTKTISDRLWLVQCKREVRIGPALLLRYLNGIAEDERTRLYGVILAAPTNFSKTSQDRFRDWCAKAGISECYLWGRGELEDMLFQPKNDNLLFAYFGISLQIRKRSRQAALRSRTTIKRKLRALVGKSSALLRDAEDTDYPWKPNGAKNDFGWWVFTSPERTFRGLEVRVKEHFAFIDEDRVHWDYANADSMGPGPHSDPWRGKQKSVPNRQALYDFWQALPDGQRAKLVVIGIVELERILEVDDQGDDFVSGELDRPHVFLSIPPNLKFPPFDNVFAQLRPDYQWAGGTTIWNPAEVDRVAKFPPEFRKQMPR
ncbi:MAG: hypothetical protein ABI697_06790 [Devosia sp.]